MVQLAIPVVPLLLLPFALIFFIVIFPLWGLALGVLGLLRLLAGALDWLLSKAGIRILGPVISGLRRAFRWVLTFGGFTERAAARRDQQ